MRRFRALITRMAAPATSGSLLRSTSTQLATTPDPPSKVDPQKAQYRFMREYTLHHIRDPSIMVGIFPD